MNDSTGTEILGQGRFLRLVRRHGWEHVERTRPVQAAFIGAITEEGELILTKEFRVPLQQFCVGCPAGLIGDVDGHEQEAVEAAVRRELIEEAGYTAEHVTILTAGPTSAGLTDEVITLVLAEGLTQVGPGGGIDGENIAVFAVPLAEVYAWLETRVQEGCIVDPKVYAILYFLHRRRNEIRVN